MNRFHASALLATLTLFAATAWAQAPQQQPARSIVKISDNLYRAQNDMHFTVFLVTSEGIIMSDPINREFSTWLKSEMKTRFNVPVRYVLYTHHHWDHASGGQVFADSAQFIGHRNMPAALALSGGDLPLPEAARKADANGNGRIDRAEATSGELQANFALFDQNKDGALSGAEVARGPLGDVHPPSMTYADRHTVTLGGKSVIMVHTGTAHAPDMSVLYFPGERTVFGADLLNVKRLPGNILPTLGEYIDAIETVEKLDFDIVAPGHGIMGKKEDLTALLQYFKDLGKGVSAGIASGKSVRDIQTSLTLDAYKSWERFEMNRPLHIAQVSGMVAGLPE